MSFLQYCIAVALLLFALYYKMNCRDQKSIAEAACKVQGKYLSGYKTGAFSIEYWCGENIEPTPTPINLP